MKQAVENPTLTSASFEELVREMLVRLGEDPEREGLLRTPERVQARHILIKTTGKSKEETAKLQAKAEDLLKQIKGGGDFAKLAEKNSEDPGSAAKARHREVSQS